MSRLFSWRSIYLVVALCAIAPCVGRAQTVDQDRFRKFRNSKANKDLIVRALTGVPPEVFPTCPGLGPTRSRVEVEKSISFDPDGVPNAGAWWERLPVHGCGNDTVLNVHFQARGDGTIDTQFALPGTTQADLDLQRNAVQYAIIAAGSRKGLPPVLCQEHVVRRPRTEETPGLRSGQGCAVSRVVGDMDRNGMQPLLRCADGVRA